MSSRRTVMAGARSGMGLAVSSPPAFLAGPDYRYMGGRVPFCDGGEYVFQPGEVV